MSEIKNIFRRLSVFRKRYKYRFWTQVLIALVALLGFVRAQMVHLDNRYLMREVRRINSENRELRDFYNEVRSKRVYHNSQHQMFHYLHMLVLQPDRMLSNWTNEPLRVAFQDLCAIRFQTGITAGRTIVDYKGIDTLTFTNYVGRVGSLVANAYIEENTLISKSNIPRTVISALSHFSKNQYVYNINAMQDEWEANPYFAIKNTFDMTYQSSHNIITYMDKLEGYFYERCDTFTYRKDGKDYVFRKK